VRAAGARENLPAHRPSNTEAAIPTYFVASVWKRLLTLAGIATKWTDQKNSLWVISTTCQVPLDAPGAKRQVFDSLVRETDYTSSDIRGVYATG
jgi:hypothetical protein